MVITVVLFGLLLVASITDWRQGRIYNWTTYPGIVAGLGLNACGSWLMAEQQLLSQQQQTVFGLVGLQESLTGLVACGLVMVICYVLFAGGVGGGDVKLVAMIGTLLGLSEGLETMLWTLIVGGCMALLVLVWKIGILHILKRSAQWLWLSLKTRSLVRLSEHERQPLKSPLFLAPSAVVGALIVKGNLIEWFS